MTLARPSLARLRAVAQRQGLDPSDEELEFLRSLGDGLLRAMERLDALPGERLPVEYARGGGVRRPEPGEDPYNAWSCLYRV